MVASGRSCSLFESIARFNGPATNKRLWRARKIRRRGTIRSSRAKCFLAGRVARKVRRTWQARGLPGAIGPMRAVYVFICKYYRVAFYTRYTRIYYMCVCEIGVCVCVLRCDTRKLSHLILDGAVHSSSTIYTRT